MKIAFYKGWGKGIFNIIAIAGIKLWTMGKYSHVELIDENNDWYSSDAFKHGGVRKLENFKHNPKNWDIFEIQFKNTKADPQKAIEFIKSQFGKKYDWMGILFSQFIPAGYHKKDKWFCSEICHAALGKGNIIIPKVKSEMVSPVKLFKIMKSLDMI